MSKTIKTRIAQKHDYELNWVKATGFVPLSGEIIIYDAETQEVVDEQLRTHGDYESLLSDLGRTSEAIPYQRMKIGNGVDNVIDLPFVVDATAVVKESSLVTEESVSYMKTPPSDTANYASISKIGGMTRKCTNLFSGGDLSFDVYTDVTLENPLPAGKYTLSCNITTTDTNADYIAVVFHGGAENGTDSVNVPIYVAESNEKVVTIYSKVSSIRFYASKGYNDSQEHSATIKNIMINSGETALPYESYFAGLRSAKTTMIESVVADSTIDTFLIPEEVQALSGYGLGVDDTYYNYIDLESSTFVKQVKTKVLRGYESWTKVQTTGAPVFRYQTDDVVVIDRHIQTHFNSNSNIALDTIGTGARMYRDSVNKGVYNIRPENYAEYATVDDWKEQLRTWYSNGNPLEVVYVLETPEIIDISEFLHKGNINVQAGGAVIAVNEFNYDVPYSVEFYKGNNDIVAANKFVGNLVGVAENAEKDGDGNIIANTYLNKEHAVGTKTPEGGEVFNKDGNEATGEYSHAEGSYTTASGFSSHAEGSGTTAAGSYSHAEGSSTEATGDTSHAEGECTLAIGYCAHSEGMVAHAEGDYSHAEGHGSTAKGEFSHAEGSSTTASGEASHAGGIETIASGTAQTAIGRYNQENTEALLIVGNGKNHGSRSNAFEIISDANKNVSLKLGTTQFTEKQLIKLINFLDTIRESGYEVTIFDMYGHVTYSKNDEAYQELPFKTPVVLSDVLDLKFKQESIDTIHIYTDDMSIDLLVDGIEGAISEPLNVEEDLHLYINLYGDNSVPYNVEPNFDVGGISYSTDGGSFSTWDNDIYVSRFMIRNDNDFSLLVKLPGITWDDDINRVTLIPLASGETSIWLTAKEDQVVEISRFEEQQITFKFESDDPINDCMYYAHGELGDEVKIYDETTVTVGIAGITFINTYADSAGIHSDDVLLLDSSLDIRNGTSVISGGFREGVYYPLTSGTLTIYNSDKKLQDELQGEY